MNDQTLKRFAKLPVRSKAQTPNRREQDAERANNVRATLQFLNLDLTDAERDAIGTSMTLGEPDPGSVRATGDVLNSLVSRASIRRRSSPMLSCLSSWR